MVDLSVDSLSLWIHVVLGINYVILFPILIYGCTIVFKQRRTQLFHCRRPQILTFFILFAVFFVLGIACFFAFVPVFCVYFVFFSKKKGFTKKKKKVCLWLICLFCCAKSPFFATQLMFFQRQNAYFSPLQSMKSKTTQNETFNQN